MKHEVRDFLLQVRLPRRSCCLPSSPRQGLSSSGSWRRSRLRPFTAAWHILCHHGVAVVPYPRRVLGVDPLSQQWPVLLLAASEASISMPGSFRRRRARVVCMQRQIHTQPRYLSCGWGSVSSVCRVSLVDCACWVAALPPCHRQSAALTPQHVLAPSIDSLLSDDEAFTCRQQRKTQLSSRSGPWAL